MCFCRKGSVLLVGVKGEGEDADADGVGSGGAIGLGARVEEVACSKFAILSSDAEGSVALVSSRDGKSDSEVGDGVSCC